MNFLPSSLPGVRVGIVSAFGRSLYWHTLPAAELASFNYNSTLFPSFVSLFVNYLPQSDENYSSLIFIATLCDRITLPSLRLA